jgi:putative adhesin
MKIIFRTHPANEGNILFMALFLAIVIGISLGSYLALTSGQEQSVSRSQRWNGALNLAEAGIEEGLAQVNDSPQDFSANSWTKSGTTYGPQTRTLSNGKYSVLIQGDDLPTIYSTGTITAPITGTVISRTVRVTTQILPLFNVALGAVGNINMNGNSMATDSWNSHDTNLSSNGTYDSSKISTNGDVASVGGIVNIGQHTIDGNLYLGPTATYTSGTNQILGDLDKNFNVNFPDARLPQGAASAVPPTNLNGTNYLNVDNRIYTVANDNKPIMVAAGLTNVTLIVTAQTFDPTSITLLGGMTNAAVLTIYDSPPSPGGSVTLNGNNTGGAIGATPVNFIFYGLPNLTSITLGGNSGFIGAIYAPEAVLTLNGGGNADNLRGAAIVKSATMNGHYGFHYDEALGKFGPAKGFIANSWQEL